MSEDNQWCHHSTISKHVWKHNCWQSFLHKRKSTLLLGHPKVFIQNQFLLKKSYIWSARVVSTCVSVWVWVKVSVHRCMCEFDCEGVTAWVCVHGCECPSVNVQICIWIFCHMFTMKHMLSTSCVLSMKCMLSTKHMLSTKRVWLSC